MSEQYSTQRLLTLRKQTRAVAEVLRERLKDYLSTLAPLLRPRNMFGDYIQGSAKEFVKGADKAFKELQESYNSIGRAEPFKLSKELSPPIEIATSAIEMTPVEYTYEAKTDKETKPVYVVQPLKWILTYSGFAPARLKALLADRDKNVDELRAFVLHYLVMHTLVSKQKGITNILEALRFPVSIEQLPEFGRLPVITISTAISTARPPDNVIIESTEVSGTDVFEEVVNVEDIARLRNPLKDNLEEVVKNQDEKLSAT